MNIFRRDGKTDRRTFRLSLTIAVMVLVLIVLGVFLYNRVNYLLDVYLEVQGAKQAETLSEITARQFESELTALYVVASELSEIEGMRAAALKAVQKADDDGRIGVQTITGKPFYGESYSIDEFPCIGDAIRGETSISFSAGKGLMFCVPAFRDENIAYVVYRLYPEEILYDRFGVVSYGGSGVTRIEDGDSHIIVDAIPLGETDKTAYSDPDVVKGFEKLDSMLYTSGSAVTFLPYDDGEIMLYAAEIKNTDYHINGYVKKSVVMEGVQYIGMLVILVFCILAAFVFMGGFLMIRLEIRGRESRRLRDAAIVAEQSNAAKSEFLANMSHEIRTPINAVLGMNEMILRESDSENVKAYARNVESAGKNLLAIINDILDFSKIEVGKMDIIETPYSLSSVLNDVSNMISFRAKSKNLSFDLDVDEDIPEMLVGDEMRIRQIMVNVLNNAVKYTADGGVRFDIKAVDVKEFSLTLKIEVSDTGIGIKEEELDNLFDKFRRADVDRNKTIEGTGLGLAITRNLLIMMGGKIEAKSVYGEGSVFTITLPQRIAGKEKIGNYRDRFLESAKQVKEYRVSFRAPEAKVLAVDDTAMNLIVIEGLLKETNVILDKASGGEEALELTKDTTYDLILMDQRMPGMDGTQVMNAIKAQEGGANLKTPMICLTADAIRGAKERYLSEGFDGYLSKPVESRALEATMIKFIPPEKVTLGEKAVSGEEPAHVPSADRLKRIYEEGGILDYEEAIKRLGSEELIARALEEFYRAAGENANEIESLFESGDYENYTIKVHALKSTAASIGAKDLSAIAARLEECGDVVRVVSS